jgi:hypothetical protein
VKVRRRKLPQPFYGANSIRNPVLMMDAVKGGVFGDDVTTDARHRFESAIRDRELVSGLIPPPPRGLQRGGEPGTRVSGRSRAGRYALKAE